MKTEEAIQFLENKEFLDNLFGYAYKRCSHSHEAEDLCSDILLTLMKSMRKQTDIDHFYGFVWTIAHRVYADFCEKRKKYNTSTFMTAAYSDDHVNQSTNPVDEFINHEHDKDAIRQIKREISFLSKIYRDVMIMYYLDDRKTSDIALALSISETTVKQRLFTARNTIRKEVNKMENTQLTLKPINLTFVGTGSPGGNDPRGKAERSFSQNLIYLCKDTPRSAKELSELLHVPMPFIEEELEIQCRGENGYYGLLKKLDHNKFISNFIMIDAADYYKVNEVYSSYTTELVSKIENYLHRQSERILKFPFLNKQNDIRFITWSLISRMVWLFEEKVSQKMKDTYLPDIEVLQREFFVFGFATKENKPLRLGFYGCDGITASNLCGYRNIFAANIYGARIQQHFGCGHNISQDPMLMMTINAIHGLEVASLTEQEKEIAAKAIECGYLKKADTKLFPQILIINAADEKAFHALADDFSNEMDELVKPVADAMYGFVKKYVPRHLISEYHQFVLQTTAGLLNGVIEHSIQTGVLYAPENPVSAEGTWMIVEK